ncbi:hypothetical protein HDF25_004325 [Pedobacter cryoconitis]|uniref:Uncharacterized protein n=1 Tax=Pedobacter cryoconitis TaxID=188932 RepID=A0A7X0J715_9SPHI|nr:hypothetical protein [Pedobacter cryoconitis]
MRIISPIASLIRAIHVKKTVAPSGRLLNN